MRAIILICIFAASACTVPAQGTGFAGVTWSSDSKWITFSQMNIDQSVKPPKIAADVYVVAPDGSGLKKITGDPKNEFNPVFGADLRHLYFGSTDPVSKTSDIVLADLAGSGQKTLATGLQHPSAPELSRDGKWIALNANLTPDANDHHPQIYVMKADGSGVKQLTSDGSIAFYDPVFSPDGKRLVYYVERGDQKDQIWSMKSDGTDQKLLTANIGHNFYPSWSADGKRILFTSNRDGKQQLYTMNADGSDVKAIGIEAFYGRFSPDGKRIAYIGGRFPSMSVFVANADGSSATKLVS